MLTDEYANKAKHYFAGERREMLPFIPASAVKILEIGCGEANFARVLKAQRSAIVTGVEPQSSAAAVAATVLDRVIALDVEGGINALADEQFDCIVFNDVLEHLVDPWVTLASVKPLLASRGVVVASIPNMRYMPVFKELVLQGGWRYRQDGVMDKTHLRFFTKSSMVSLFNDSGYVVDTIAGINGIEFPWKFGLLNKLLNDRLADTRYQQYACVARLAQ